MVVVSVGTVDGEGTGAEEPTTRGRALGGGVAAGALSINEDEDDGGNRTTVGTGGGGAAATVALSIDGMGRGNGAFNARAVLEFVVADGGVCGRIDIAAAISDAAAIVTAAAVADGDVAKVPGAILAAAT